MEKVKGLGGVFFRARDPKALAEWYRTSLGIEPKPDGYTAFDWLEPEAPNAKAITVWSAFSHDTSYFDPIGAPKPAAPQQTMFNYRVENLDKMLAQLRAAGVRVDDKIDDGEFGRFGWATDPEGNRFELWQPPTE